MVSVCLPSYALLQHLPSYLGFSYLGRGVSLHGCSSKVQLTAPYLGRWVSPHCLPSWPSMWDSSSRPSYAHAATAHWTRGWSSWLPPLASGVGAWGSSSQPPLPFVTYWKTIIKHHQLEYCHDTVNIHKIFITMGSLSSLPIATPFLSISLLP